MIYKPAVMTSPTICVEIKKRIRFGGWLVIDQYGLVQLTGSANQGALSIRVCDVINKGPAGGHPLIQVACEDTCSSSVPRCDFTKCNPKVFEVTLLEGSKTFHCHTNSAMQCKCPTVKGSETECPHYLPPLQQ